MHLVDDAIAEAMVMAENCTVDGDVAEPPYGQIGKQFLVNDKVPLAVPWPGAKRPKWRRQDTPS